MKQGVGRAVEEEEEPGQKPEESVRKTKDSVQHGYTEHACGQGPQSPEAFFFPSGVRVGSKFINIGRPTWPCAQTQDVSEP